MSYDDARREAAELRTSVPVPGARAEEVLSMEQLMHPADVDEDDELSCGDDDVHVPASV